MERVKSAACGGECLFGRCPYPRCVRQAARLKAPVEGTITVESRMLPVRGKGCFSGLGLAVDIGTTTVAAALFDLESGNCLRTLGEVNAQVRFGVDVMTRIAACREDRRAALEMGTIVRRQIGAMAERLSEGQKLSRASITGNTLMLSLLLGADPSQMGEYPFQMPSGFGVEIAPEQAGLLQGTQTLISPSLSAFVGGDIMAGVAAVSLKPGEILADIGTNGELALMTQAGLVAAATAAGPALEGAALSCGMASAPGAIQSVELRRGGLAVGVIGGGEPKGICGSGAIDALACLLDCRIVDETGRLDAERAAAAGLCSEDGAVRLAGEVFLTAEDIRKLQLAKAAVAAGVLALTARAKMPLSEVERLYLAGGFGMGIREESALRIGLLPAALRGKIVPGGNTALAGAAEALLSAEGIARQLAVRDEAQAIDLSLDPVFSEAFVEEIAFPGRDAT